MYIDLYGDDATLLTTPNNLQKIADRQNGRPRNVLVTLK